MVKLVFIRTGYVESSSIGMLTACNWFGGFPTILEALEDIGRWTHKTLKNEIGYGHLSPTENTAHLRERITNHIDELVKGDCDSVGYSELMENWELWPGITDIFNLKDSCISIPENGGSLIADAYLRELNPDWQNTYWGEIDHFGSKRESNWKRYVRNPNKLKMFPDNLKPYSAADAYRFKF